MLFAEFFPQSLLFLEIGPDRLGMFQNEGNRTVHLCQRADGRIRLENSLWSLPSSEVVNQDVKADSRASYTDFTFADLQVFTGWQIGHGLLRSDPLAYPTPGLASGLH